MKKLYASFKKSKWFPLVAGLVSIIFGILLILSPQAKMENIALFIGLAIALYGLFSVIVGVMNRNNRKLFVTDLILGIVLVIVAVLIFANLKLIGKYLPSLVGFFVILSAIAEIIRSVSLMSGGMKSWWLGIIPAAVGLILGFIFLLKPGFVGASFGIFAGVTLLVNGLASVINFFQLKK
ncbi:MAG: DUF308 domain-containing protein [Oscillospiraceae bacterium]|nr:DUF308 domain-containing protein [Oscillospiraceae bacterium]